MTTTVSEDVVQKRLKTLLSFAEECVTEADLENLLRNRAEFRLYDGFEPSGRMHIAQGVFKALAVNKCTSSGGTFVFWVADWFGLMNDKMGGDLDKIKVVGEYFVEVWKSAGMNMENVEFRWASEDINQNPQKYWGIVLDLAKRFTVARVSKCCQIMGRTEGTLTSAQILYPLMQCADIFFLQANICQLGLDQRKVNMLARDYCDSKGIKHKPVILSHHMISGLKEGQAKMSKSDPNSAIFMEDKLEDIQRKINLAFCPLKQVNESGEKVVNPCLDYIENICFNIPGYTFVAGGKEYSSYEEVSEAFYGGSLSESDLKTRLIETLNERIEPVRTHFEINDKAKHLLSLIQEYKKEKTTKKFKFPINLTEGLETKLPNSALILFPVVTELKLSISVALSIVKAILSAPSTGNIVILLPDLSSIVHNAYASDKKTKCEDVVNAVLNLYKFVIEKIVAEDSTVLKAETVSNLKGRLCFVTQTDLLLSDSSNYWINAINSGRNFQLSDNLSALGYNITDSNTPAGPVISSLMRCADIIASQAECVLCLEADHKFLKFAESYLSTQIDRLPEFIPISPVQTQLLEKVSLDVKVTTDDLLLTDLTQNDVAKKIKRAFCEPGNIEFNPPLRLAEELGIFFQGSIKIGDKVYSDVEALRNDCKSEEFHPKDLKDSVTHLVKSLFARFQTDLQSKKSETGKLLAVFQRYFKRVTK